MSDENNAAVRPVVSFGMVVADPAACRDFYVRWFDLQVVQDLGWYVHLRDRQEWSDLAFLKPEVEQLPTAFHAPKLGPGVYVGVRVPNAAELADAMRNAGLTLAFALRDEPWGERHFGVTDPGGTLVNVWQPIAKPRTEESSQRDGEEVNKS